MTEDTHDHRDFTIERVYPNCKAHVWAAWSVREKKAAWFRNPMLEMDFRPGGFERSRSRSDGRARQRDSILRDQRGRVCSRLFNGREWSLALGFAHDHHVQGREWRDPAEIYGADVRPPAERRSRRPQTWLERPARWIGPLPCGGHERKRRRKLTGFRKRTARPGSRRQNLYPIRAPTWVRPGLMWVQRLACEMCSMLAIKSQCSSNW
jgi:hypothetical protein